MIREQAAHVVNDYEQLILKLRDILHRFSYGCSINKIKINTVYLMANCEA